MTGDRNWTDEAAVARALFGTFALNGDDPDCIVISGMARGADTHAATWARNFGTLVPFPAYWDDYGKAAGPIRNAQMLEEGQPDVVLAFHNDLENSKGTKHMVNIARKAGVPVYHIRSVA